MKKINKLLSVFLAAAVFSTALATLPINKKVEKVAAAGKAAHLAGALAAQTTLPVIGIPVKSSTLDGLDALLSTVQMPSGMPVATVAIDGAANAALLAAQILAVEDETLAEKLLAMRRAQHDAVIAKDAALVVE